MIENGIEWYKNKDGSYHSLWPLRGLIIEKDPKTGLWHFKAWCSNTVGYRSAHISRRVAEAMRAAEIFMANRGRG